MARDGVQIMKEILAAPNQKAREEIVLSAVRAKEFPSWLLKWRPIKVSATIDGKPRTLEYEVSPDYVSLGDDENYFRAPMLPATAQEVADTLGAILPSSRMVDEIYANATGKLVPQPIAPNLGRVTDYSAHEIKVQQQMKANGLKPGQFLAGHKKDIVVGPNLNGSRVAIYGWHDVSGSYTGGKANRPIQPYSLVHDSNYTDYAHGVRLVKARGYLDGEPVSLRDVFEHPKLHVMVSNQGPFTPRFPNLVLTEKYSGGGGMPVGAAIADLLDIENAEVGQAQAILMSLGYDIGKAKPDGVLGPMTKQAIVKFQSDRGMPTSGKLDEETRLALGMTEKPEASVFSSPVLLAGVGIVGGVAAYFAYDHFKKRKRA